MERRALSVILSDASKKETGVTESAGPSATEEQKADTSDIWRAEGERMFHAVFRLRVLAVGERRERQGRRRR